MYRKKHTVVFSKTSNVFQKTSNVFSKTSNVFLKTTVTFFKGKNILSEEHISGKTKCTYPEKRNVYILCKNEMCIK